QHDAGMFARALEQGIELGMIEDAVIAQSERDKQGIWNIREDLVHIVRDFQPFYAFDISLPVGDMEQYMSLVTERLHRRWPEGAIAFLGHVDDGNLHIAIGASTAEYSDGDETYVYEPLEPYGGSVSAEHGIGLEKKRWFPISRSPFERRVMQQFKALLDPNGFLNPGKEMDLESEAG